MLLAKFALLLSAVGRVITQDTALPPLPLPAGVNSSYVDASNSSGLIFHILSSGYDADHQKPLIGYFVVAPDQRVYGRTTGWDTRPHDYVDLAEWDFTNLVRDIVSLVYTLGYTEVHSLISHDFGTVPGTYGPILRPDLFKSSVQVSIPFTQVVPPVAVGATLRPPTTFLTDTPAFADFEAELQALDPPREHYQWYNSQRGAAYDWVTGNSLGLSDFMRKYFFVKSHNWPGNDVLHPPAAFTAKDFADFPLYQILLLNETMPENVEMMLNGTSTAPSESWLSDAELDVFVSEFNRTGFQGDMNWYRVFTLVQYAQDVLLLAGAKISVPTAVITGANDWSTYLEPGALAAYNKTCTDFWGLTIIPKCGH